MNELPKEIWGASEAYERYVGRWSRPVSGEFLNWLALPARLSWADIGCGTGALVEGILACCAPQAVLGIDRSEGFVSEARGRISDTQVLFQVGDALRLPLENICQDVTVSGLVLNFVADPEQMVREMMRVTRVGGTVAAYVWDYASGMAMMRHFWDAALAVCPHDAMLDEAERFPLCQPEPLTQLWKELGLAAVQVRSIEISTVFQDFDDFWTPFLGGQGAAPTYLASLEAQTQEEIRSVLQSRLVSAPNGTIALSARAWAVQGKA